MATLESTNNRLCNSQTYVLSLNLNFFAMLVNDKKTEFGVLIAISPIAQPQHPHFFFPAHKIHLLLQAFSLTSLLYFSVIHSIFPYYKKSMLNQHNDIKHKP